MTSGVIFMATADSGGVSMWSTTSGVTVSSTQKRTGVNSLRIAGSASYAHRAVPAASEYYARYGIFVTQNLDDDFKLRLREGTTVHVSVLLQPNSGYFQAFMGTETGTSLGTGGVAAIGNWYCVEVYAKIANSPDGEVRVKINGTEVITATGVDTRNGATGVIDNIYFQSDTQYMYIDDVIVRDDAWPGTGGIYVMTMVEDGSDTGWTASETDRHECVDEVPPTFTNYISADAGTPGTKSTFTVSGLTGNFLSIDNVRVAALAQLDLAGLGQVKTIGLSDGEYSKGSPVALDVSPLWVYHDILLDPGLTPDGAWQKAAVNALEVGVETV